MARREAKLLISDHDKSEREYLRNEISRMNRGKVYTASNGIDTLAILEQHTPDILVLDMVMPGMDGLSIMRRIRKLGLPKLPHVLALVEPNQPQLSNDAFVQGAGAVLEKTRLENLASALDLVASTSRRRLLGGAMVESRIYFALIEVGIARRLDGFDYLKEAIMLCLEDVDYQNNLSKRLYPAIARQYNTSATCVERSIRHAVETAWLRGRLSVLQREFGNTIDSERGKPTNSEFIARMADKMRNGGAYLPGGE